MKRGTRIALGIAISAIALCFAVPPQSEWPRVWEAFARVQYVYVIPLAALTTFTMFIRCQRWQLLLRPIGHVPMLPLFSATCVGFFCNMVLPLRAGEVVRAVLLGRRTGMPVQGVLGSVLLERLLDMLTILGFLAAVVVMVPVSDTIRRGGTVFVVFAMAAVPLVVALQRRHPLAMRLVERLLTLVPERLHDRTWHAVHGFIDGLQSIGGTGALLRIGLYSVYLWTAIAGVFTLGFVACGLPVPLVSGSLALVTVVAGAVSAPSAPGFIGTFQFGCVTALALFGISDADATPFAIVVWAVQWLTQIVLGVVFLLRENISFRDIHATEERSVPAGFQS